MPGDRETLTAKVRRLERENRVWREREQDLEERYQGPADVEGVGGRPAVIILRDKNMGEVQRVIDDLPNVPGLRRCPECGVEFVTTASLEDHVRRSHDGRGLGRLPAPLGFRKARNYVRDQVLKMVDSLGLVGPYNTALVRDRHRVHMFIHNRAGMMVRPRDDVIGDATRSEALALIERVFFAPTVPHLAGMSQETEVQPVEAERKGFG